MYDRDEIVSTYETEQDAGRRKRYGLVFLATKGSNQRKLMRRLRPSVQCQKGNLLTPDEQLDRLGAELNRLKNEHPNRHGVLRLANNCLRSCSKWKWEQHGWCLSDGGVMWNYEWRRRRAANLASVNSESKHDPKGRVCSRCSDPGSCIGRLIVHHTAPVMVVGRRSVAMDQSRKASREDNQITGDEFGVIWKDT